MAPSCASRTAGSELQLARGLGRGSSPHFIGAESMEFEATVRTSFSNVVSITPTNLLQRGNRFRDTRSPFPTPNEHLLELALDDTLLPSQTVCINQGNIH